MVGFGANRRGGRLPSFILIFLMVIIAILSFNYWTVSNKHSRLLDELAEVQTQVKRTDAARSRLEKRNSELMVQVDTHRKQIDQKDGDYSVLEGKLQGREALIKMCSDEKMKVQGDVTAQMTEIQRLKEQLKDLNQELMKQEEQLREVKKNSTTLERKLEYESLQCGRQIAQLKDEYEETKKSLEEEASKLRQSIMDGQKGAVAGRRTEGAPGAEMVGERHTVATHRHDSPDLKEEMGKPGSDAGMPGIEDSEVGKIDDVQFALKKPAITQKHDEDVVVGAGAGPGPGPGVGAADGPGGQGLSLDQPRLQQDRVEGRAAVVALPAIIKQADKPIVFEEDNKAVIKADELGEQQRQLHAPDNVKGDIEHLKGIPLPPNPAQVPNPLQLHPAKDQVQAEPVHHRQSRFFDENESPVDPQHGSKLADYNGDDGNVGEYEADKQAELAYNEEEDGDGGEEDVQDDEDRDMQGDRAVDYGKRHQAIDIL
ncbi:LOW QUALITY PROTEIN: protein CASC4 [Cottoperca gobio]|uniref:Protein GOLM2 n=1 Tax=Cottoperca gobio TaxID=56716 RepID=A0A6J2RJX2_COTGO|nr:LOW QUALITY PROTEIN: protein CASC4 [Cottoperca gobio]